MSHWTDGLPRRHGNPLRAAGIGSFEELAEVRANGQLGDISNIGKKGAAVIEAWMDGLPGPTDVDKFQQILHECAVAVIEKPAPRAEPVTVKLLFDLLVRAELIYSEARDDPEGYDDFATVRKVTALANYLASQGDLPQYEQDKLDWSDAPGEQDAAAA